MTNGIDSTGVSVMSEEKASPRKHRDSNKVKSAYGVGHKKKMHPLMLGPGRPNPGKLISLHSASKNNLSEFTQRIMSAKLLRVKQVQNQLNETQIQLNELINENRALRNMQKRQEGALRRYEGHQAELPQLIRSHNEEIRALKASNKIIKAQLRESNIKLRERENELEALKDNYNKLKKLSTEKNLLEREKLQKQVEDLQDVIKEQEEKIQVLSRKILLESKNYRHHLNVEVLKHKETQKDLNSALSMISKLENQLIAKDRAIPSSKILLRRDNKSAMPLLTNKSLTLPAKTGLSEDNILNRKIDERNEIEDSPDVELELLNEMISSEETPSPTQDILPEILKQKKSSLEIETTEKCLSNSGTFQSSSEYLEEQSITSKYRKTPLPKKSSTFSADLEMNAKMIAETLNEDMQKIDALTLKLKNDTSSFENKSKLDLIYEEVKNNVSKFDRDLANQIINSTTLERISEEDDTQISPLESRRNVPKRKLKENEKNEQSFSDFNTTESPEEFSEEQQQKYETMSKTWNNLKNTIKEERKKAEEKIKELNKINGVQSTCDSGSSGSDIGKAEESSSSPEDQNNKTMKQELRFVNFTDDAYILQELEKTDKIFNRLKNEKKKSFTKTTSSVPSSTHATSKNNSVLKPKQQNVKSFRSESQRDPQYLKEFQSEYQKQNLIKALKAIDDGSLSNEESEDSDSGKKKNFFSPKKTRNVLKQCNKLPSNKPNKDLITELFGSNRSGLENAESLKLECPATTGANE